MINLRPLLLIIFCQVVNLSSVFGQQNQIQDILVVLKNGKYNDFSKMAEEHQFYFTREYKTFTGKNQFIYDRKAIINTDTDSNCKIVDRMIYCNFSNDTLIIEFQTTSPESYENFLDILGELNFKQRDLSSKYYCSYENNISIDINIISIVREKCSSPIDVYAFYFEITR